MAMRFCDSFGHLTTATLSRKELGYVFAYNGGTADVASTPNGSQVIAPTGGWDTKGALTVGQASGVRVYPGVLGALPATRTEWFVGVRVKTNDTTSSYKCMFQFVKTNTVLGYVKLNTNGTVSYYRKGTTGTYVLVATSTYSLNTGVRYYFVYRPVIGSSGSCSVRIDGTEILSVTETTGDNRGPNTDADCDTFDIAAGGVGEIDDLVIWDTSATDGHGNPDPLTSWVADLRVYPLSTNGAGTTTEWTPSAGANWDCVDEKAISDADYVSTAAAGAVDLYTMEDVTGTIGAIYGVQLNDTVQKDQPDARILKNCLLPGDGGAVRADGMEQTVTLAWKDMRDIWGTNPFDSGVWTQADINALQCGQTLSS